MQISKYIKVYGSILVYSNGIVTYVKGTSGFFKILYYIWKLFQYILQNRNMFQYVLVPKGLGGSLNSLDYQKVL
jgi:hypothetical protein